MRPEPVSLAAYRRDNPAARQRVHRGALAVARGQQPAPPAAEAATATAAGAGAVSAAAAGVRMLPTFTVLFLCFTCLSLT